MAHADFVAYYESRHAPLILSSAPQIEGYRRNYLCEQGAIVAPGLPIKPRSLQR